MVSKYPSEYVNMQLLREGPVPMTRTQIQVKSPYQIKTPCILIGDFINQIHVTKQEHIMRETSQIAPLL